MEKTIEVMRPSPQERVPEYTVEQNVDEPDPQIKEETVEVIQQGRSPDCVDSKPSTFLSNRNWNNSLKPLKS